MCQLERPILSPSIVETKTGEKYYLSKPLGVGKLKTMVKRVFEEANIPGDFTNHSLRATGVSMMFVAGVPKPTIQKWSGRRSIDSLRLYETRRVEKSILMPYRKFF